MRNFPIGFKFTGTCCLLSFGHPSWSGTPFGLSSERFIPADTQKKGNKDKKEPVSFEFDNDLGIL